MKGMRKLLKTMLTLQALLLSTASCYAQPQGSPMKQESSDTEYHIRITFDDPRNGGGKRTLTATLNNSSTSRAIVGMLPMTLRMMDLYGNEMCYRFPQALPTDDARDQSYEVGEIMYWPPAHSFVIRYAQNGEIFEMQKMGRVDSGWEVFDGIGDIDVTFELIETTGIDAVTQPVKADDVAYTVAGTVAPADYKGIIIKNGKKLIKQ